MELSDVVTLLRNNPLLVGSTVSPRNTAQSAMLDTVITDEGTVIFASMGHARKVENLAANPSMSLFAWAPDTLLSAQVDGVAAEADEGHRAWAEDLFYAAFPEKRGAPGQTIIIFRPQWARLIDTSEGVPPKVEEITIEDSPN